MAGLIGKGGSLLTSGGADREGGGSLLTSGGAGRGGGGGGVC